MAATILKKEKSIQIDNNVSENLANVVDLSENWEFVYPTRPDSYDDAIPGSMLNTTQRQCKAAQAEILNQFEIFEGYETDFKEKLE